MSLNIQHNQDGTYTTVRKQFSHGAETVLLSLRCPGCGTKLKIRERMLNRKGKCPMCGQRLVVQPQSYVVQAVVAAECGCPAE